jgi:iron complex outermembrane recepter protein
MRSDVFRACPGLRTAAAVAVASMWPSLGHAQSSTTAPADAAAATTQQVIITGNPLGDDTVVAPSSILSGEGLVLRRSSTLGETLDGLPGVSSSYFGPNANRPVIRGQDGDRIRVLSNAGASLDASSLSVDHAVPIDPLAVERIEVLRGPAALLYGGSAVGGVVNAIDNRIPKQPATEVSGAGEVRFGGAAQERGASALVEAGGNGFSVHADAFWRRTDDLRVPTFDRPTENGTERRDRVVNSASDAEGGAIGASWSGADGYIGAAADTYRNTYGTVAEEEVTIKMKRDKLALAGELRQPGSFIRTIRGQLSGSDYAHTEFEGAEVGTVFKNRGVDSRLELAHAPLALGGASLQGVFGLQSENFRFSALGAEAFVPGTRTSQVSVFALEEWAGTAGKLSFGGRVDRINVDSQGDAADAEEPRFGEARSRRFTPKSGAIGGALPIAPQWQLTGNLAYTERAPTFYELYADGVHIATAAYERGDPLLNLEKGSNLDVALQWKAGGESPNRASLGAFASRFSNYIALRATGETFINDEDGAPLPVFAYQGVSARLQGVEFEGEWRALEGTNPVDLDIKLDSLRATDRSNGQPLPRIAPLRGTLGAKVTLAGWALRGEVVHAARQNRVPDFDEPTPSYTLLNLSVSRAVDWGPTDALAFVKLSNVTNELAYNAASISTVRVLSPLPGRGVMAGLRVVF